MTIDEVPRCALSGCDVPIELESDGRPRRKYCTSEHRGAARQMRRESAHRPTVPLPVVFPEPPRPVRELVPSAVRRRRDRAIAMARRCRAVAVLGSAGLLITGGGLIAASSPADLPSVVSETSWNLADPDAQQRWADRARITLASLDTQITQLDKAAQAWNGLPAQRKYPPLPIAVRQLQQRRRRLVTQRDTVRAELKTYQQVRQTTQRLAETEDGLSAIESTLDQSGSPANNPEQAQTTRILRQELQQRQQRRDAQRAHLVELHSDLQRSMSVQLPDPADDNSARSLTSEVATLVAHPELDRPSRRPDRDNASTPTPEVTAPHDQDDSEVGQVGHGAPPNPGRNRPDAPRGPQVLTQSAPDPAPTLVPAPLAHASAVPSPRSAIPRPKARSPISSNPPNLGRPLHTAGKSRGNHSKPHPRAHAGSAPSPHSVPLLPSDTTGSGGDTTSPTTVPPSLASGAPVSSDGGLNQVPSPPVARVAQSEPDPSPSSRPAPRHGAVHIPQQSGPAPMEQLPSALPATPNDQSTDNSTSGDGLSTDDERARAASEIAGSMLGRNMGDLVSSAAQAQRGQHAGRSSGRSSSADSGRSSTGATSTRSKSDSDSEQSSDLDDSIVSSHGLGSDRSSPDSDSDGYRSTHRSTGDDNSGPDSGEPAHGGDYDDSDRGDSSDRDDESRDSHSDGGRDSDRDSREPDHGDSGGGDSDTED